MDFLADNIRKAHPGTRVEVLDALHGYQSLQPLWVQVVKFGQLLLDLVSETNSNIHLIGYSQGNLLKIKIDFKIYTDYLRLLFPHFMKDNLFRLFYSSFGQKFSVANYWKDPHHIDLYLNYSSYLAIINNETANPQSFVFKDNFLKLKQLVLIGGSDDGVITPWQSSHFGYYNASENITEMADQEVNNRVYIKDSFGLKTLHSRNAISTYSVPGVYHLNWHKNITIFYKYILPHLT
uniref:palmitoyl-CoA hydrolase n=1 Tax=Strigamia maritima TaxID=126957 RepID=T1IJS0_STRMM